MTTTERTNRQERLSELVTQLCGAPLDRSRQAIIDASARHEADDSLFDVADALVRIRQAA